MPAGLVQYLVAPLDPLAHRARAEDHGPPEELEDLADLALIARAHGVHERLLEHLLGAGELASLPVRSRDPRQRGGDAEVVARLLEERDRRARVLEQAARVVARVHLPQEIRALERRPRGHEVIRLIRGGPHRLGEGGVALREVARVHEDRPELDQRLR